MAEGGFRPDFRPDFLSITNLEIPYSEKRREAEPYSNARLGEQTEEQKLQQEKALKNPFTKLPDRADYGYPNSVLNISVGEHSFRLPNYFHKRVKNYDVGYLLTDAPFTKLVMNLKFNIFEMYIQRYDKFSVLGAKAESSTETKAEFSTETKAKSATGDPEDNQGDLSTNITAAAENLPTDPSEDITARLEDISLDSDGEQEVEAAPPNTLEFRDRALVRSDDVIVYSHGFSYKLIQTRGQRIHMCYTVRVPNGNPPFTVATGIDTVIFPESNLMPSFIALDTAPRTEVIEKVNAYLDGIPLTNAFTDCLAWDSIIYFWSRGIIDYGHCYWLMIVGQTVHLYHLSSSLQLEPMDYRENLTAMRSQAGDFLLDSVALAYFHAVKSRFVAGIRKGELPKIMDVADRCSRLLNSSQFPMEYTLINLMCSEYVLPYTMNIDEPELANPNNPNVKKDVSKDEEAFVELNVMYGQSLDYIRCALEGLVPFLKDGGHIPYRAEAACPEAQTQIFNFNFFLEKLDYENVQKFDETEYSLLFKATMEASDLSRRMAACAVRKLFFDAVILGRMTQSWKLYEECFGYSEVALSAWIALCSIIKPDKLFPLPLRPLYMIGDVLYNIAREEDTRKNFFDDYIPSYKHATVRLIQRLTSTEDNRCIRSSYGDNTPMQLMEKGLEFVARAVLYTDVETEVPLLVRLCVMANDIAYNFLEITLGKKKPYPTFKQAKEHLLSCKRVLDMVLRISGKIRGPNSQVHIASLLIKAKWYQTHAAIYAGRRNKIHKKYFEFYDSGLQVFDEAFIAARKIPANAEVGIQVVRSELLDLLLAIIWRWKEFEDQEKRSYHKEIIPLFKRFIKECQAGVNTLDGHYFEYRYGLGCAALAEYLFGLFRESKHHLVRDMTEHWFLEAVNCLKKNENFFYLELLKIICDFMAFLETAANEENMPMPNEFHHKTMKTVMWCYDVLKLYSEFNWNKTGDKANDQKITKSYLMLQLLERRLLTVFLKRRSPNVRIDLSSTDAHQFFCRCMNRTQIHIYVNLASILEDVKRILTAEGIL